MKKLLFITLFGLSTVALAQEGAKSPQDIMNMAQVEPNKKSDTLTGTVIQDKVPLEGREKMIAQRELEIAETQKKLQETAQYLEVSRKKLVDEATKVKVALENREKEIQRQETAAKIKPKKAAPVTKSLGDLIQDVSKKHPVN